MNNQKNAELIYISAIIANILAKNLSNDEINILGALFTVIGDNLALIAAQGTVST